MKIIGIDPGSYVTGYGLIEVNQQAMAVQENGIIKIPAAYNKYKRLATLFSKISIILQQTQPDCAAVEDSFYHKNVKTAMHLGQVRGVILLALQQANCIIYEFSPLAIKQAVAGYGQASKDQVEFMVRQLLNMKNEPIQHDCSDALAAAICLSQSLLFREKLDSC